LQHCVPLRLKHCLDGRVIGTQRGKVIESMCQYMVSLKPFWGSKMITIAYFYGFYRLNSDPLCGNPLLHPVSLRKHSYICEK
jgi:hypothetical protein